MQTVQPIRDVEQLKRCYEIARAHDAHRRKGDLCWELLLAVGFSTSLRISDIARLRVRDIVGVERVQVTPEKTRKRKKKSELKPGEKEHIKATKVTNIYINREARKRFEKLLRGKHPDSYVFVSRQKDPETRMPRPITRQRAYQVINKICRQAGVRDKVGCHTLRKTFGYRYYKETGDLESLRKILCHSEKRETLIYIGLIQEEIDESLKGFKTVF